MGFLKKIGLEPFIIMLFGSILLAYIYPPLGMEREGGVSLGDIANWGVSFIFFFTECGSTAKNSRLGS